MLRLEGVTIRQGDFALSADLEVGAGAFVALLGPSGAGKSTLLNAVAGFLEVEGTIRVDGSAIEAMPPAKRPVAMLFQDNNLFPHLSVGQNVALGLGPKGKAGDPRVAGALARVGLAGMEGRKPGSLSGGQQSRAALARVLLQDKPLVLLDEPFSALGPGQRAEMMALCREVLGEAGRTVLIVTHDLADAARADQIIVVAEGCAAPPVESAALLADPPEVLRNYLEAK